MFYLIHFTKIVYRFPVKALSWMFFTLIYIVLSSNPYLPITLLTQYTKQEVEAPYFHALIDGEQNHSRLSRNLLELPQVTKVDLLDQEEIIDQVNTALSGIKHELPEGILALNYNGLKVTFAADVKESSQVLVRDYLTRLGGLNNVTLGPIVKNENSKPVNHIWSDMILYFTLVVFFIFWVYLTVTFAKLIHRECYLIQEFQRRSFVANKVYAVGIVVLLMTSLVLVAHYGKYNLGALAASMLIFMPLILLKRRYQW